MGLFIDRDTVDTHPELTAALRAAGVDVRLYDDTDYVLDEQLCQVVDRLLALGSDELDEFLD